MKDKVLNILIWFAVGTVIGYAIIIFNGCGNPIIQNQQHFETIVGVTMTNLSRLDNKTGLRAIVTPYTKEVIEAVSNRKGQTDSLLAEAVGENGDTLTFVIRLINSAPCQNIMIISAGKMQPLLSLGNMPCSEIWLTDIEQTIYLENERHEKLKAMVVCGRRNERLMNDETLIAKFNIGNWAKFSKQIYLKIEAQENKLSFEVKH